MQIGAFIVGSLYDINTIVILYFAANLVMYFPNMLFAVSVLGGSFLSLLKSISLPLLLDDGGVISVDVSGKKGLCKH